jgi:hypothetical protein
MRDLLGVAGLAWVLAIRHSPITHLTATPFIKVRR